MGWRGAVLVRVRNPAGGGGADFGDTVGFFIIEFGYCGGVIFLDKPAKRAGALKDTSDRHILHVYRATSIPSSTCVDRSQACRSFLFKGDFPFSVGEST